MKFDSRKSGFKKQKNIQKVEGKLTKEKEHYAKLK